MGYGIGAGILYVLQSQCDLHSWIVEKCMAEIDQE